MSGLAITVYSCEPDESSLFEELSPRFGIVPTIVRDAVPDVDVASMPHHRCISVGHKSEISGPTVRALREVGVEYISSRSIGVDHIDLRAAERVGITVENVVYAPDGVADHTVMLILMAIRNAAQVADAAARRDFRLPCARGKDLRDLTVGVLGVGNIGEAVIRRLRGFGCRVLACTNGRPAPVAPADLVTFDDLLRTSDIVTLHLPLDANTHHVIGHEQIATMKRGAVLVNTGRGALVDTGALVAALERGSLGGAALDVLEGEEELFYHDCTERLLGDHPLLSLQRMPNVIVTPHTAYYTERALRETVENTLINCLNFERGRTHEETQDRRRVRGHVGGARHLREVRDGDRSEH